MEELLSDAEDVDTFETGDGINLEVERVTPSAVVVCGSCGAKMKNMGPTNRNTRTITYDEQKGKFSVGTWVYSCRYCRKGSLRALLNPMLDTNDIEAILTAREQVVDDIMNDRVKFSAQTGVGDGHIIVEGDELVSVEVDGEVEEFHESRKDLEAADN